MNRNSQEEYQPDTQQGPSCRLGNLHQGEGDVGEEVSGWVVERNPPKDPSPPPTLKGVGGAADPLIPTPTDLRNPEGEVFRKPKDCTEVTGWRTDTPNAHYYRCPIVFTATKTWIKEPVPGSAPHREDIIVEEVCGCRTGSQQTRDSTRCYRYGERS